MQVLQKDTIAATKQGRSRSMIDSGIITKITETEKVIITLLLVVDGRVNYLSLNILLIVLGNQMEYFKQILQ